MQEIAEALVSSGMAVAGYDTINVVCNGWTGRNSVTGELVESLDAQVLAQDLGPDHSQDSPQQACEIFGEQRRPRRPALRPSPLKCDTNRFEIIPIHDHSRMHFHQMDG